MRHTYHLEFEGMGIPTRRFNLPKKQGISLKRNLKGPWRDEVDDLKFTRLPKSQ